MKNSFKIFLKLLLHGFAMIIISGLSLLGFFYILLPHITRHHQYVAVPLLVGQPIDDAKHLLQQKKLNYYIKKEKGYSADYPPNTILIQTPRPGDHVKYGRRIYLTINSETPPPVSMPNLLNGSIRNAQVVLKMHGLLLGKVKYRLDKAKNAILAQEYEGESITPGTTILKGEKIDLVIGTGLRKQSVKIPSLIGKDIETARSILISKGLNMGSIIMKTIPTENLDPLLKEESIPPSGTIWKQHPKAEKKLQSGDIVNVWAIPFPDNDPEHIKV